MDDYLDPSNQEHRDLIERYYEGEEHSAYAFVATDDPEGGYEVVRYNSVERERPSGGIYLIRDHAIGA